MINELLSYVFFHLAERFICMEGAFHVIIDKGCRYIDLFVHLEVLAAHYLL